MASLLASIPSLLIVPEPLTPHSFEAFGTAINSPLPSHVNIITDNVALPHPSISSYQPKPVIANQSTALKYSPISPLTNNYSLSSTSGPSSPLMTLFACFPRNLTSTSFPVRVLERHPYTTQTFTPLGLSTEAETSFLVIVAPSLSGTAAATIAGNDVAVTYPPDLERLRAFVCHGRQAVTYSPGTWHAPMVVLGKTRVDFVVTQFTNGVGDDDCQEVEMGEGIAVDVGNKVRARL